MPTRRKSRRSKGSFKSSRHILKRHSSPVGRSYKGSKLSKERRDHFVYGSGNFSFLDNKTKKSALEHLAHDIKQRDDARKRVQELFKTGNKALLSTAMEEAGIESEEAQKKLVFLEAFEEAKIASQKRDTSALHNAVYAMQGTGLVNDGRYHQATAWENQLNEIEADWMKQLTKITKGVSPTVPMDQGLGELGPPFSPQARKVLIAAYTEDSTIPNDARMTRIQSQLNDELNRQQIITWFKNRRKKH
jgi:hypothetical protein